MSRLRRTRSLGAAVGAAWILALFAGCSGDDGPAGPTGPQGPAGPQGPDGGPGPVSMVIVGADGNTSPASTVALAIFGGGAFPAGSDVAVIRTDTSTPVLADLSPFEVAVVYSNVPPFDRAALGDVLADYVDAGGRLVLMQACFTDGFELQGRIMTAGYSPLLAGPGAGDNTDRTFDLSSISLPPHPVFTGVNPSSWDSQPVSGALSAPPLASGATLIASFANGHNAIAVNSAGTILGVNLFPGRPPWVDDPDIIQLAANAVLFLAGEL